MSTWRELIAAEMAEHGDTFDDVQRIVFGRRYVPSQWVDPVPGEIDRKFDAGHGNGAPFTAWTARRVYFPAFVSGCCNVEEWCASVPRNPCDEATDHVGGFG